MEKNEFSNCLAYATDNKLEGNNPIEIVNLMTSCLEHLSIEQKFYASGLIIKYFLNCSKSNLPNVESLITRMERPLKEIANLTFEEFEGLRLRLLDNNDFNKIEDLNENVVNLDGFMLTCNSNEPSDTNHLSWSFKIFKPSFFYGDLNFKNAIAVCLYVSGESYNPGYDNDFHFYKILDNDLSGSGVAGIADGSDGIESIYNFEEVQNQNVYIREKTDGNDKRKYILLGFITSVKYAVT